MLIFVTRISTVPPLCSEELQNRHWPRWVPIFQGANVQLRWLDRPTAENGVVVAISGHQIALSSQPTARWLSRGIVRPHLKPISVERGRGYLYVCCARPSAHKY